MTAAVAWSYDSLSGAERELFEALCLLEGSFDLDGVRAVSGDQAALPTKLSLIDKSLVVVLHGSPRRYRILETLRQYAEQRRSADRTAQVRQQIVTWVSSAAERAETEMYGPNSRTWMVRLDQDKGTIRAALGWRATRPPGSASPWAWCGSGIGAVTPWRPSAPSSRCHRRAQPCRHPPRDCRPRCWSEARSVSCCFGTWPATTNGCPLPAALDQARGLAAITDDESARSYALAAIAYFEAGSGQIEQALINAGTAAEIVRRLGSDQFLSFSLLTMGMAHLRAGSVAEAERCAAAGVCHADACGYAWGAVASSWIMCKARIAAGDFSEPTVIGLARVIGASSLNRDITSWLVGLVSEAYLFLRLGDGQRAAELVGIASRQGQRIGFTPEAMDPVETRLFLDETMQAIQERGLTTWYEQGRGLDTQRAFERVAELVSSVAPEPG